MKAILFSLLALTLLVPARGGECVLRFHPPSGTTFEKKLTRTSATQQGTNPPVTNVWTRVADDTFQADGDGYTLQRSFVSLGWVQNGQQRENPLYPLVTEFPLVYRLGPDGALKAIRGLDALNAAIPERVDEKFRELARKVFASDAVLRTSRDEFASFAARNGRTVSSGSAWIELASDEGENGYYVLYRVTVLSGSRVTLESHANTNLEALRALSPEAVGAFRPARGIAPSSLRIEGEGTQVVDADSLIPVSGKETLRLDGTRDGLPFHREQTIAFETAPKR